MEMFRSWLIVLCEASTVVCALHYMCDIDVSIHLYKQIRIAKQGLSLIIEYISCKITSLIRNAMTLLLIMTKIL